MANRRLRSTAARPAATAGGVHQGPESTAIEVLIVGSIMSRPGTRYKVQE